MTTQAETIAKERALRYIQKRGTDAPVDEIQRKLSEAFSEFNKLVESIDANQAVKKPAAGGWCVQEVVDHLTVSHRPAMEQLQSVLDGKSIDSEEVVPLGLQSEKPISMEWQEVRHQFAQTHDDLVALLNSVASDTSTAATGPVFMEVKATNEDGSISYVRWVEQFDWKSLATLIRIHTLEHLQQIQRILSRNP